MTYSKALDATASGVQMAALLALDKQTAETVNLVESDKKKSVYEAVAKAANKAVKADAKAGDPAALEALKQKFLFVKANTKTAVIATIYSGSSLSAKDSFQKDLEKKYTFDSKTKAYLATKIWEAIAFQIRGVVSVLDWFKQTLTAISQESSQKEFWYTSASGKKFFFVLSKKTEQKYSEVQFFEDQEPLKLAKDSQTEKDDVNQAVKTAASQFIQGFDAKVAEVVVAKLSAKGVQASVNMDSFEVTEKEKAILLQAAQEAYYEVFAEKDYFKQVQQELEEQAKCSLPDYKPSSTFKLEEVLKATYLVA